MGCSELSQDSSTCLILLLPSPRPKQKGSEFLKKIKKLGCEQGVEVRLESRRGKGSHSTLFYGKRFTIIRNLKDELKTGTYQAMLKQLGIDEYDMR